MATPHLKSSARGQSILWRGLRPELVRSNPVPLSPDANILVTHDAPDWRRQRDDVLEATTRLVNEVCSIVYTKVNRIMFRTGLTRRSGCFVRSYSETFYSSLPPGPFANSLWQSHRDFWWGKCVYASEVRIWLCLFSASHLLSTGPWTLFRYFNDRLSRGLRRSYVKRIWGASTELLIMGSV